MKIQERCCQGLIASSRSQRRTVEADRAGAMRWVTASRASSGHDQRTSGVPVSAGSWQASALTWAVCSAVNAGGRPGRLRSARPGRPCAANRPPPGADGVQVQARLAGDARVGASAGGVQDDLRADPHPVLGLVAVGHRLQPLALLGGRGYRAGWGNGHGRRAYREKWIRTATACRADIPAVPGQDDRQVHTAVIHQLLSQANQSRD
jgi:hypothetical protein